MERNRQTDETILREVYNIGNPSLFNKNTLLQQAVEYLTEQDEEVIKLRKFEKCLDENDNILAEQKLIVIFKYKNEKYIFDLNNINEDKYFLWWYLRGFFRLDYVYYGDSNSFVSSRLCLKSRKLAENLSKEEEIINYFKLYLKQ